MTVKGYPTYRGSGIDWLGPVPAHWTIAPLKVAFEVRLGKMLQPERSSETDHLAFYLRAANIQWAGVETTDLKQMWFSPAEKAKLQLRHGDLLISEGGDVGRSAVWDLDLEECYFQNSINRVRPRLDASTRFLYYWMSTIKDKGYIDVLCNKSTIAHFTAEKVQAVPTPLPPTSEQTAIAAFLDRETGKIDTLVEEQRRLIELLKEKRQAIISHAVTKSLDANAKMKPSGVEWLGDVPEHWDVVPCGYRYDVQLGRMLNEERAQGGDLRPYLRVLDVQWHCINVDDLPVMNFPPEARQRYRLEPGDLLVNEGGSYVGRSAIWRGELAECYYQKALHRLRPRDHSRDTAEFLLCVMEMATKLGAFIAGGNQTTIDHLTAEQLRGQRLPFPPAKEQAQIAEFLAQATGRLDLLEQEALAAMNLLTERRAALISAAVTGKIDVREATTAQEDAA